MRWKIRDLGLSPVGGAGDLESRSKVVSRDDSGSNLDCVEVPKSLAPVWLCHLQRRSSQHHQSLQNVLAADKHWMEQRHSALAVAVPAGCCSLQRRDVSAAFSVPRIGGDHERSKDGDSDR